MRKAASRLIPICAAAGVAVLANAPIQAQQTYTLRFNHVLGPSEPYHKGFQQWAERVKERTKGGLTIDVFHSAQLGVEEDIIEQIRQGANIGQNTDAARLGNYVSGIAAVNAPYFVTTLDKAYALADSPTMIAWQKELADKHGLKVGLLRLGAGLPPLLHQQGGPQAGGSERLAHPHASCADLAGIDPRARRGAGGDEFRRRLSRPAAAGDRRGGAGLSNIRPANSTRC